MTSDAQARLRASEARLRALITATSDVIYRMSPDWLEMRQLDGRGFLADVAAPSVAWIDEYLFAEDQPQILAVIQAAIETKGVFQLEHRVRRADGSVGWTSSRAVPVLDAQGEIVEWFGTATDITGRRNAEAQLELMAAVVECSDDAIIGLTLDGTVTNWNRGAEAILGWAADEMIGQSIIRVVPADRLAEELGLLADLRAGRSLKHFETRRLHRDGYSLPVSLTISPLRDQAGYIVGGSKTMRDVSDRERAAAALAQANESLERRVAERTEELERQLVGRQKAETALVQARKLEAIGQLTGGIAHDFNNLLTIIATNLDLVSGVAQHNDRLLRLVTSMQRAVGRGAQLISQLLAFARRQPLLPEVMQLDACIQDFLVMVQHAVGEAVEVSFDAEPGLWPSRIDPSQFETAVINLAFNARDAMPHGGRLTITARNVHHDGSDELPAGDYVAITVADTGTGMTPEVLEHATEPFFTTKEVGKGSGLGLSQAYGFLRQSDGGLRIESEPGRGTRITLSFPRASGQSVPASHNLRPQARIDLRSAKVLVVEDNLELLDLVTETLRKAGLDVLGVPDAARALDLLAQHPDVQVMLSDVVMPNGISGIELGHEALRRWPELRVLLMSGYPVDELEHFGSMTRFPLLSKPFRPAELFAHLDRVLAAAR